MEWAVVVPVAVPGPVLAPTLPPDTAAGTDLEPVPLTAPVTMVLQACVVSGRKEAEGHAVAGDTKAIDTHSRHPKITPRQPQHLAKPLADWSKCGEQCLGDASKNREKGQMQNNMCFTIRNVCRSHHARGCQEVLLNKCLAPTNRVGLVLKITLLR